MKFGNITIGGMSLGSTKIGGAKFGNTLVYQSGGVTPTPPHTQVNYLCNATCGEYINLGVTPNANTIIDVTYQDFQGNGNFLFGSRNGYNNGMFAFGSVTATTTRADCMAKSYSPNPNGLGSHTAIMSKAGFYIDGSLAVAFNPQFSSNNYPLFVFAFNNAGTPSFMNTPVKISNIKIRDGGSNYIHDLIPVVYNGVGCFYDTIGGTYFYNQGTGAFTWE